MSQCNISRRGFLSLGVAAVCVSGRGGFAQSNGGLVSAISATTLWNNLDGQGTTWFHPKVCMVPRVGKPPVA
ncbi:MAG TPA: hypothetical protein VM510_13715, partial [Caulifigura sp.]|nr:hypothetical protein [Caulifigura sp.]